MKSENMAVRQLLLLRSRSERSDKKNVKIPCLDLSRRTGNFANRSVQSKAALFLRSSHSRRTPDHENRYSSNQESSLFPIRLNLQQLSFSITLTYPETFCSFLGKARLAAQTNESEACTNRLICDLQLANFVDVQK